MIANLFLAILIVLMTIRDGALVVRHGRPNRLAFVAFWVLLGYTHFTGRSDFYPAVALTLVVALWLKRHEVSGIAKMFKSQDAAKPGPSSAVSGLWDRELDGKA